MPLETSLGANGIMTITFANQKKLNAWTQPMMEGFFDCLQEAGSRSDVAGVVVTGEGKYYSAGVDLSNVMKPMLPSNLVIYLRDSNQKVFQTVIDFPKPIVAAVNGPALGAAVTTATLMGASPASSRCPLRRPASAAQPPPPPPMMRCALALLGGLEREAAGVGSSSERLGPARPHPRSRKGVAVASAGDATGHQALALLPQLVQHFVESGAVPGLASMYSSVYSSRCSFTYLTRTRPPCVRRRSGFVAPRRCTP